MVIGLDVEDGVREDEFKSPSVIVFFLVTDHSLRKVLVFGAVVELDADDLSKVDFVEKLELDWVDFVHLAVCFGNDYDSLKTFSINTNFSELDTSYYIKRNSMN